VRPKTILSISKEKEEKALKRRKEKTRVAFGSIGILKISKS